MSSIPKIALAGATGNLGPALLSALLGAGYRVSILTRSQSPPAVQHANAVYVPINWSDMSTLTGAVKDHSVVISALPMDPAGTLAQKTLIDACLAAGVRKFVPSTFGSDFSNKYAATLPIYAGKVEVISRLKELATSDTLSYVDIACGPYLDWCIMVGLFLDPKNHTVTFYDGGDVQFSATTLASVGKALVGALSNWKNVKNRIVRVHDAVVTQKQLVAMAREVQADKIGWTESHEDTEELERKALEKFSRGEAGVTEVYDLIKRSIWGRDFGGKMAVLDNSLLGIEGLNENGIKEVVSRYC